MLFRFKVMFWAVYEFLRDEFYCWKHGIIPFKRQKCYRCGAPYDYNDSVTFPNGAILCYECDADDRAEAQENLILFLSNNCDPRECVECEEQVCSVRDGLVM